VHFAGPTSMPSSSAERNAMEDEHSHIAEEITGAHWSGPRFFGLRKRSGFKPKALIDA